MIEWEARPGRSRDDVFEELISDAIDWDDRGTHIWAAKMNNRGTVLFCYELELMELHDRPGARAWHLRRLTEDMGPIQDDCPIRLLDVTRPSNVAWRARVQDRLGKGAQGVG